MPKEKVIHRSLIALGGGGVTHGLDPLLDDFVLSRVPVSRPRMGYLGWGGGGDESQRRERVRRRLAAVYGSFESLPAGASARQASAWVDSCDLIYVAGGNTKMLLAGLRAADIEASMAQAMDRGLVLVGVSAGASVWFDCAWSDAEGLGLRRLDGLGLFEGSFCPHYDSEPERRPSLEAAVDSGSMPAGLAVDEGVAIWVTERGPQAVCSARAGGKAWRVSPQQGSTPLT